MQLNIIEHRLEMLATAERLAMEDKNPKNLRENMDMIFRCSSAKLELWNIKLMIQGDGRKEVA
jgi:hypothetical protein